MINDLLHGSNTTLIMCLIIRYQVALILFCSFTSQVAFTSDFSHECEIVSHRSKDWNKLDMSSLVTAMLKAFQEKTYNSNFRLVLCH